MGNCDQSTYSIKQEAKINYTEGSKQGQYYSLEVPHGWTSQFNERKCREYNSSKYLWFKLESGYQKEIPEPKKTNQESKDKPLEEVNQEEEKQEEDSNKGMDSCDCNDSLCDEIEKVLIDDDEGISKVAHEIHLTLLNIDLLRANWFLNTVNLNQSDFTKLKKKILDSNNEYQQKTMTMKVLLVKIKKQGKRVAGSNERHEC